MTKNRLILFFRKESERKNNYVNDEESENENRNSNVRMTKNFNMPMQIISKKESPVILKNILNTNDDKQIHSSKQEKIEENKPSFNYKSNKNTLTVENNYEDRIQPFEMVRSKSRKTMSTVVTAEKSERNNSISQQKNAIETWFCDFCKKLNKPYEYKCQDCRKVNINQREILETLITGNTNGEAKPKPSLTNQSSLKSPKDDKKIHPTLERKNTEKRLACADNTINNNGSMKKVCPCLTNSEKVVKNNICTLCNRYIEFTNHEGSFKRKIENKDHSPYHRNSSQSSHKKEPPIRPSDPKLKKEDSVSNLNSKYRSPSSNVTPSKTRPSSSLNKHKDILIEDEEAQNPFGKVKETKSNVSRINSSHSKPKKKAESILLGNTPSQHSATLTKGRK